MKPEIQDFADRMIIRFSDKYPDEGDSWRTASLSDLWDRAIRNFNELGHDIFRDKVSADELLMQAADVGNMIWMLSERVAKGYTPPR